jgi:metal-responsive CopG/Arc/MetJ family transcriptional regulator
MAKKKAAKMGRPVNPDGPAVVVAVSVPKSVADDLDATAKAQGVSKSAAVVEALRGWLKRKKR